MFTTRVGNRVKIQGGNYFKIALQEELSKCVCGVILNITEQVNKNFITVCGIM